MGGDLGHGDVLSVDLELTLPRGGVSARRAGARPAPAERSEEAAWLDSIGFDLRRSHSLLHRTTREILDLGYDSLPELLAEVPRLEVRRRQDGKTELRLHPTVVRAPRPDPDPSCPMDVYLNGSLVRQRISGDWEMSLHRLIAPRFLTGVEVFEGARAPVGDPAGCGAILLWVSRLREAEDPSFTGVVTGRVTGLSEDAFREEVRVRLEPLGAQVGVDDNGFFDFGAVPPGRYTAEADIPAWGVWSTVVDVRLHATTRVEIDVDPGTRLPEPR